MRIVDVFLAIPYILLVMGVVFALGPSLLTVILVMGATRWVHFARVVRADVLSIREREFVAGARARGNPAPRPLFRPPLPHPPPPTLAETTPPPALLIIFQTTAALPRRRRPAPAPP